MKTYTEEEVEKMLVASFIVGSAGGSRGIYLIKGDNFGEKAKTMMKASENEYTIKGIISKLK